MEASRDPWKTEALAYETEQLVIGELGAVGGHRDWRVPVGGRVVFPHHDRPNRPNRVSMASVDLVCHSRLVSPNDRRS